MHFKEKESVFMWTSLHDWSIPLCLIEKDYSDFAGMKKNYSEFFLWSGFLWNALKDLKCVLSADWLGLYRGMNQSEERKAKEGVRPTGLFPRWLGVCDATQGPEVADSPVHLPRCVWKEPIKRRQENKTNQRRRRRQRGDHRWADRR